MLTRAQAKELKHLDHSAHCWAGVITISVMQKSTVYMCGWAASAEFRRLHTEYSQANEEKKNRKEKAPVK